MACDLDLSALPADWAAELMMCGYDRAKLDALVGSIFDNAGPEGVFPQRDDVFRAFLPVGMPTSRWECDREPIDRVAGR